jgi:hypothetical protein
MGPGHAHSFWEPGLHHHHGGGLELVHIPVRPPHTNNLTPIIEAFEGLWLSTSEDCASEGCGPLDFDCERLGDSSTPSWVLE